MKKAVIIYGAPASGKSTRAKFYRDQGYYELNRDNIRFGVVQPGGDWTTWNGFEKGNKDEDLVTKIWRSMFEYLTGTGKDVVISDTNCQKNRREGLFYGLKALGYEVTLEHMCVPLMELLERDKKRGKMAVGGKVITDMFNKLYQEE
jgi:predicted kinase